MGNTVQAAAPLAEGGAADAKTPRTERGRRSLRKLLEMSS